ncbi:MAG: TrmH family RNA methyltransferase [Candidatus Stygibacter frigidus]|nr:TrmH family RNA methyltransferase [Candidatus Stygibacter frigidus]
MKFSYNKFEKLDDSGKETKILKFINKIEKCWEDIDQRRQLIVNFAVFLAYFHSSEYQTVSESLFPEIDRREFLKIIVPIEQKLRHHLKENDLYIHKVDGIRERTKLPLIIVLDNLRSAFNVGAIIRTAECFGIEELYFCGYTPDNDKVAQTAMGTRELIKASHFDDTPGAIEHLRKANCRIYALETVENATSIYEAELILPAALIVGNEALGISTELLETVDAILEIPLAGWKNSLNVGSATAIAISEFYRKK